MLIYILSENGVAKNFFKDILSKQKTKQKQKQKQTKKIIYALISRQLTQISQVLHH